MKNEPALAPNSEYTDDLSATLARWKARGYVWESITVARTNGEWLVRFRHDGPAQPNLFAMPKPGGAT